MPVVPNNAGAEERRRAVLEVLQGLNGSPLPTHIVRALIALSNAPGHAISSAGIQTLMQTILSSAAGENRSAALAAGMPAALPYRRLAVADPFQTYREDESDDENKQTEDEEEEEEEEGEGMDEEGYHDEEQEEDGAEEGLAEEEHDYDMGVPQDQERYESQLIYPHEQAWGPQPLMMGGEEGPSQQQLRRRLAVRRQAQLARGSEAVQAELMVQGPPPVSFLQAGQVFSGVQRLSSPAGGMAPRGDASEWHLVLRIHHCDWAKGVLSGVMEAQQPSSAAARGGSSAEGGPPPTVVTYWEAELIDNVHHTFRTDKWGSNDMVDLDHWTRFGRQAFTERMRLQVLQPGPFHGRCSELSTHPWVFLRLKECEFVTVAPECGLTITGFYFLAVERATGSVVGFYHAADSTPYQRLELQPVKHSGGMQFGAPAFA